MAGLAEHAELKRAFSKGSQEDETEAQKQPASCSACGGGSSFPPAVLLAIRCALSIPLACRGTVPHHHLIPVDPFISGSLLLVIAVT